MDMIGRRSVRDLLRERASRRLHHPAVVVERADGQVVTLSYEQLAVAVTTVAAELEAVGVTKGDTVVMKCGNSIEFIVAWLSLAWLGAVAVPANVANTPTEMKHVFAVSEARVFLADPAVVEEARSQEGAERVTTWLTTSGGLDPAVDVAHWMEGAPREPKSLEDLGPDDLAQLVFTSGTTSLPKAVMLTHGNYLYSGEREARTLMLDETDRLFTALPLFHVNAQSNTLLAALTLGATAIFTAEYRASKFWAQVRSHRATQLSLVAMQLRTVLAQPEAATDTSHDVRRVLYAINVSTAEKDQFERRFGVEIINGYGLSEAMTVVTAAPVFGEKRWPSIGLPALGRDVRLVDPQGDEVGDGQVGEIVVGGVPGRSLMAGYYRDSEATRAALRDGWLFTGDNGRMDSEGYIYFVDRSKDVIKRAGENISSSEVESVLITHPAVAEVAVVGVPDPIRDEAVKAFVVLVEGADITANELTDHARASLAAFKVPTEFEFLVKLPKTSIGKIQKQELRDSYRPVAER